MATWFLDQWRRPREASSCRCRRSSTVRGRPGDAAGAGRQTPGGRWRYRWRRSACKASPTSTVLDPRTAAARGIRNFYVDSIALAAPPPPAVVNVTVDLSQAVREPWTPAFFRTQRGGLRRGFRRLPHVESARRPGRRWRPLSHLRHSCACRGRSSNAAPAGRSGKTPAHSSAWSTAAVSKTPSQTAALSPKNAGVHGGGPAVGEVHRDIHHGRRRPGASQRDAVHVKLRMPRAAAVLDPKPVEVGLALHAERRQRVSPPAARCWRPAPAASTTVCPHR